MSLSSTRNHEKRNELNYQKVNKRVGIFGGTFDPIHIAHLIAAQSVYTDLGVDEIWFMPSHISPHKQERMILASNHRLNMLQLAIEPYPEFKINRYEIEQTTVSYTYNTMLYLNDAYPDHQFYFIIGGDMVEYLPNWYRYEELLQIVAFVAVKRPHHHLDMSKPWMKRVYIVEMPQLDVSSTDIRNRCKSGRSIRFLVPDAVERYIKEHHLYVE